MTDAAGLDPNQSRFAFDALKFNLGTAFSSDPETPISFGLNQRVELILPYRLNGVTTKTGDIDPNAILTGMRIPIGITNLVSIPRSLESSSSYGQETSLDPQIFLAHQNIKSIFVFSAGLNLQQKFSVPMSAEDILSARPHVAMNLFQQDESFAYTPDMPLLGARYVFANLNPSAKTPTQSEVIATFNPAFAERGIASLSGLNLEYKNQMTPLRVTDTNDEVISDTALHHTITAGTSFDIGPTELALSYSNSNRVDSGIQAIHTGEDFSHGSSHTFTFEFGSPLLALILGDRANDVTRQELKLQESRAIFGKNVPFSLKGSYTFGEATHFSEDFYTQDEEGNEAVYDGSGTAFTPYHRQETVTVQTFTLKPSLSIPTPNERFTFKLSGELIWNYEITDFLPSHFQENQFSSSANVMLGLNYNWNVPKKH